VRAERTADANNRASAVFYARSEYASFSHRLLAAAIDATVILAFVTAISAVILTLSDLIHPVHVPIDDTPFAPDFKRSERYSDLMPLFTLPFVYFAYAPCLDGLQSRP
jgi:uncharacterized RDD family membrane protein YckC